MKTLIKYARSDKFSDCLTVPAIGRNLNTSELPLSVRLGKTLKRKGITRLGGLQGVPVRELWKMRQCGKTTVEELFRLLERVATGEFQPTTKPFSTADTAGLLRSLEQILDRMPRPRDREMFLIRLGMADKRPPTLAKVGAKFKVTRERVRQIMQRRFNLIRREGGPRLLGQLKGVAAICKQSGEPMTPQLLAQWLGARAKGLKYPLPLYAHLLRALSRDIPG